MLQFLAVIFLWKTLQFWIDIGFEAQAGGELPWWRGVLMLVNGLVFCVPGVWKMCAASLSGEKDLTLAHKIISCICLVPTTMGLAVAAHVAQLPATILIASVIFISGPPLQYYQTWSKYPEPGCFCISALFGRVILGNKYRPNATRCFFLLLLHLATVC